MQGQSKWMVLIRLVSINMQPSVVFSWGPKNSGIQFCEVILRTDDPERPLLGAAALVGEGVDHRSSVRVAAWDVRVGRDSKGIQRQPFSDMAATYSRSQNNIDLY